MQCPQCHHSDTKVIDSRSSGEGGGSIRRRRKCEQCDFRFTTYEKYQMVLPMIVKNDGRRENFSREKILKGLKKACQKRPVSVDQLEQLIDEVEALLSAQSGVSEINAQIIGEAVMSKLRELDPVSFVRFASFYWDYQSIQDFVRTLQRDVQPLRKSARPTKESEILS